jgi:hypothetical protein
LLASNVLPGVVFFQRGRSFMKKPGAVAGLTGLLMRGLK